MRFIVKISWSLLILSAIYSCKKETTWDIDAAIPIGAFFDTPPLQATNHTDKQKINCFINWFFVNVYNFCSLR